jgi:hypothetical protein
MRMEVSAWSSGGSTYGIRVGTANRDRYFDPNWTAIEVEIEGEVHRFAVTPAFWKQCPEFRDSGGTVIRDWLQRHGTLDWPSGHPPQFQLLPLGGQRFRLVA